MANQTHSKNRISVRCLWVLEWLLLFCPCLFGLFYPWCAALISPVLIALLLVLLHHGLLRGTRSIVFLAALSIPLFHLGGILWGTDRGMAPAGAVQFLPLPLFVLLLEQYSCEQRMTLLRKMPYAASVMVLLSLLLSRIPALQGWFLVAGRQSGFFQYPNTYALYLLLSLILVLFGQPLRFGQIPCFVILLSGIILSGSRTVFVLLLGVLLIHLLREKSKRAFLTVLLPVGLLVLSAFLIPALTGEHGVITRYLTISLSSSEFLGRLLYARDALPVILKHPLGLGYTGYRWLQGSFQTGVYSVQHVHNEFLQLLLDAGWIPAGLFTVALFRSFRSEEGGLCRRLFLAVLILHCLLDFDTQFVSIGMLLFLAMDTVPAAAHRIQRPPVLAAAFSALVLFSLWVGSASFLQYLGRSSVSAKMDPVYTAALIDLLPSASEEQADRLADRILTLNPAVASAYDVKARSAFHAGRWEDMITCKKKAVSLCPYHLPAYLEFSEMLRLSYERCLQQGDREAAAQCLRALHELPAALASVKARTSPLGWRIHDQPNLELPSDLVIWLNTHRALP